MTAHRPPKRDQTPCKPTVLGWRSLVEHGRIHPRHTRYDYASWIEYNEGVPVKRTTGAGRNPGASVATGRPMINRGDHELLRFTISWRPYGQVPEDELFLRFGLTRERFTERLREISCRHRDLIHPNTADRILELCEQIDGAPARTEGR
jgi:hypothetical protein